MVSVAPSNNTSCLENRVPNTAITMPINPPVKNAVAADLAAVSSSRLPKDLEI